MLRAKLACSGKSCQSQVLCLLIKNIYSFTGLNSAQAKILAEKAHIYMTADGRISMAGLNTHNIEYFAQNVDAAVKGNL